MAFKTKVNEAGPLTSASQALLLILYLYIIKKLTPFRLILINKKK